VWLCIVQGLAHHVANHAETLRHLWVEHEGRLELKVRADDFVKGSSHNDWPRVFGEFSEQIELNSVAGSRDKVVASFSTTGPVEKAACEIALMSTLQSYFSYKVVTTCGIPSITLLGTLDDWRTLEDRAEELRPYQCDVWLNSLKNVLRLLREAVAGRPNREFFQSFYKYASHSGGDNITGWIQVLFPYLRDPNDPKTTDSNMFFNPATNWTNWPHEVKKDHGITSECLPSGLCSAPFIWQYFETNYPMEFLAGFVGISQEPADAKIPFAVRPAMGWMVREAS